VIFRVVITDRALARIDEQARFIAVECEAPMNAARWLAPVLAAADSLETMPRRCPLATEDEHRPFDVHGLDVDGFPLLFTVDDGDRTVRLLGAGHARQLPRPDELAPP